MAYKLRQAFNVPYILMYPTLTKIKGVETKEWHDIEVIFGTYAFFGGSEKDVNGLTLAEGTGQITTWYRPDIKKDCRLRQADTGQTYDITSHPENIEGRRQYVRFNVLIREGGA